MCDKVLSDNTSNKKSKIQAIKLDELITKLQSKLKRDNIIINDSKISVVIPERPNCAVIHDPIIDLTDEKVPQIFSFIKSELFYWMYKGYLLKIVNEFLEENFQENNAESDQQIIEINDNEAGNSMLQLNQVPNEPKEQNLRRSTRKRKATCKLENCNKKFAAAKEAPVNYFNLKDLYFFKLSLMPVKNKSTTDEVEKETIRAIELTKKSEKKKQKRNYIHEINLAVAVFYHKEYIKQQLETESRKNSLITEAVQVESESISTISSQQSNDKHTFENHDHTYAKLVDKEERKKSLDSGIISPNSEDYYGLINTQEQENEGNIVNLKIKVNDSESILAEYKRFRSESECAKQNYVALKLKENPINIEYNPKKSRKRPINADDKVTEAREKNNIASRLSRHKKKVHQQHLSFCVEYYTKEYEILTSFKEYSMKIEKELEKAAAERAKL